MVVEIDFLSSEGVAILRRSRFWVKWVLEASSPSGEATYPPKGGSKSEASKTFFCVHSRFLTSRARKLNLMHKLDFSTPLWGGTKQSDFKNSHSTTRIFQFFVFWGRFWPPGRASAIPRTPTPDQVEFQSSALTDGML